MSEEVKKADEKVMAAEKVSEKTAKIAENSDKKITENSAKKESQNTEKSAPAAAKNGEAPKKRFGSARNFSSENFTRENSRRGGRGGRGDRRDNRRNSRDNRREEEKIFEEQTIAIDRVSRTVKGGRRLRFKALVVVGDKKTRVGVGVAKGRDVQQAVEKATSVAKKNLVNIPIENGTIPHEVEVKFGGAHILLKPAAPGTGIIAGGVVRSMIGVTGINNLLSKSLGSTNKTNIAYATSKALSELVPRKNWLNQKKGAAK